ncbi:MAG: hypothetical protein H7177_00360 [Rhizobacter sp.]|nr:hypothetical protein [Bacteriovorax sp.]
MMKFTSLAFVMLAVSAPAFAAVDYSYCQQQFNLYAQSNKPCKNGKASGFGGCLSQGGFPEYSEKNENIGKKTADSSYYPFELTADGKIKAHPTLNYQMKDGKEIISSNSKEMDYSTIVTRNEKGEITEITSSYNMKTDYDMSGYPTSQGIKTKPAAFKRTNESTTKLEIKNGKCIPTRSDSLNTLGDEAKQEVTFDAKLCRNVGQFFKKNPEAASCFDNSLMAKAQGIFDDYYKDNSDIYGEAKNGQFGPRSPLKTKLKTKNTGMYGYPGMGMMGGIGLGMGMGMPGASTEQMLTTMGLSIDSIISAPTQMQGMNGFGTSPVLQAMQLQAVCQGNSFGMGMSATQRGFLTDESVWKNEASQTKSAANVDK